MTLNKIEHFSKVSLRTESTGFSHARPFLLPSFHEGLPIALLEAVSYRLPVRVSDIAASPEVDLPYKRYFRWGDAKVREHGAEKRA